MNTDILKIKDEENIIFIDETGDHNLYKIDETYPVFALGAMIIKKKEYVLLAEKIDSIKKKYFKATDIILHSSELKRPTHKKSDPRNAIMNDVKIRKEFYEEIDLVVSESDMKIIICFIEKINYTNKYRYPTDPYYFCFENILNRIIKNDSHNRNFLLVEKRHSHLDTELKAEYERLCKVGTYKYRNNLIKEKTNFEMRDKKENIIGLQMIDLILYSVVRYSLGKEEKMNGNDLDPKIIIINKMPYKMTIFPNKK